MKVPAEKRRLQLFVQRKITAYIIYSQVPAVSLLCRGKLCNFSTIK